MSLQGRRIYSIQHSKRSCIIDVLYVRYAVIGHNLQQNANEGCKSCVCLAGPGLVLSFIACLL